MRELKNAHNSVTVQNRTHVYMNFFDHKDLGNHLLQLCPKVVKHPVESRRVTQATDNSDVARCWWVSTNREFREPGQKKLLCPENLLGVSVHNRRQPSNSY